MPEQEVFDALKYRIEVDRFGTRRYYNSVGQLHRDGGPAAVFADNTKQWYQRGVLDRTDGPAIEYVDGTKVWYRNGLLHRPDGPAVEWADGNKFWYISGRMMTEEEFIQAVKNV